MAYQQVRKPKFYIDMMSYFDAISGRQIGYNDSINPNEFGSTKDLLYLNPVSIAEKPNLGEFTDAQTLWEYSYQRGGLFPNCEYNFIAILNHNLCRLPIRVYARTESDSYLKFGNAGNTSTYNINQSINIVGPNYDATTITKNGFSLGVLTNPVFLEDIKTFGLFTDEEANLGKRYVGSWAIGRTWSPPHNPNLSMNITREYDGIKEQKKKNGQTYSDISQIGNPLWCNHNAWQLWSYHSYSTLSDIFTRDDIFHTGYDGNMININYSKIRANQGRTGRRKWRLTWDDFSDSDMFVELEQSNDTTNIFNDGTKNPFLENESFISRVWTPTLGGSLKFIIQLDDQISDPGQFAICKFKKNSLKITAKAPNLYSFSVDIEEAF